MNFFSVGFLCVFGILLCMIIYNIVINEYVLMIKICYV